MERMTHDSRIFVAGHTGLVGSAVLRAMERECLQPMREEFLLSGPLEPTNESYAVAKIAGIKLCQAYRRQYGCSFISAMPINLYGPNDNFDSSNPDGMPQKLLDVGRLHDLGWRHRIELADGIESTYGWFLDHLD